MISIIVPVYNTEKYLKRCIDSLLNQTFKDFELIIINDCSPDNSEEIIQNYLSTDKRIVYLKNEKNLGCEKSRIKALTNCRGEFVTFVDSDDYVTADFLNILVEPMINDDKIDSVAVLPKKVVSESFDYVETFSKESKKASIFLGNKILDCFFGESNVLKMGNIKIFKKDKLLEAFEAVPSDVSHKVSDDIMFTYQYYKRSSKVLVRYTESYYYEQSNGSMCREISEKSLDNITVWNYIFDNYKQGFNKKRMLSVSHSLLLAVRYTLYKVYKSSNLKLASEKIHEIKQIIKKVACRYKIRHLIIYFEILLLFRLNKTKRV